MGSHDNTAPGPNLNPGEPSSRSLRRNPARLRHTGTEPSSPQSAPKPITSDHVSSMPFFDKRNPSRFFAVLKGVSARVDEKAGVTKQVAGSPDYLASRKKRRPVSVRDAPEAKKGRVDVFGEKARHQDVIAEDKGKARAQDTHQDGSLKSSNLQSHRSMPNVTSLPSTGVEYPTYSRDDSSMDIDSLPEVSFTSSQATMPPPSGLPKKPLICGPTRLSMQPKLPQQNSSLKKAKSTVVPQLHPLILQNSSSKPSTCPKAPIHPPRSHSTSLERCAMAKEGRSRALLASSPETVPIKSRARPPQLGMRRAHTLPGQSTQTDKGSLPTTQRRFRPPYPQSRSQQRAVETQALASLEVQPSSRMSQVDNTKSPTLTRPQTCISGSSSSESFCNSIDSHPATVDHATSPLWVSAAADAALTESPHEDPDSSFGDMSFDMDALEETMRKYD